MNISHFVSNFPNDGKSIVYGESGVFLNLCLNLAKRGHKVQVFTPSKDRKDTIELQKSLMVFRYGSIFGCGIERFSFTILYKPLYHDTDIVHIHSGISPSIIAGFLYSVIKKKPLVMNWHSDSIQEYDRFKGIIPSLAVYLNKLFIADLILSHVNIIVSPSEYYIGRSHFLKRYRNKIVVIPNGVNLQSYNISYSKEDCKIDFKLAGSKVILFVGVLLPLKGVDILLKAIPKVVKEHNDAIFMFLGGGDIEKYQKVAESLFIEKHLRFTGYVYENISFYYKASDIFVLPSLTECFPLVNLEAMASGLPIVASDVGGVPDIVKHGENGLLFPAGDSDVLADSIIYLLDNEELRVTMGKRGREMVENYSWERIAEMMENLYVGLIHDRSKE